VLTSYNGWTASATWSQIGGIKPLVIRGEPYAPGVRAGDVHFFFSCLMGDIDKLVEPIDEGHPADDWGASFRQNRNSNNLSCHASGTAVDHNATQHPNGKRNTFTPTQAKKIRELCKGAYRGLVRWGGDFTGTPDEMHFEIIGTPGQIKQWCAELLAFASRQSAPPPVANIPAANLGPQPWLMLPPVRSRPESFQRWYNAYPFRPALLPVISPLANNFGPKSEDALKKMQARYGLVADGIDGPLTKKVLWDLGWRG